MDDLSPPLFDSSSPNIVIVPMAKKPKAAGKVISFPAKKAAKPKAAAPKKAAPKKKTVAKPKAKKKPAPVKAKKPVPKKKTAGKPVKKAKANALAVVRSERLDLRLSKREKAMLRDKATKLRRTLTSIFIEFVEKLK